MLYLPQKPYESVDLQADYRHEPGSHGIIIHGRFEHDHKLVFFYNDFQ